MVNKYVSIIIPTYQDWNRLVLCVNALEKQTFPKEMFEVIIVNNDPEEEIPDGFTLPEGFNVIVESKPGSYAARNTALRAAKGEIVGFTDSDCIPHKDWIKNAVEYMTTNASCSRVAGNILVLSKSRKPTLIETYNNVYSFPQKWHVERIGTSVTANLFTYKSLFDKVGFFDENLLSMGDSRWALKAGKAGYSLHFVENVIIYHPPRNLAELAKKEKRLGGAEGTFRKKSQSALKNIYAFLRGFKLPQWEYEFLSFQGKGLNKGDRFLLLCLRHYLMSVRRYERLRVQLGKKPSRT